MNQAKESSVLFSLRELMELEEERLEEEKATRIRAAEREAAVALAADRRAREDEEARRRAEEVAARAEAARAREEAAHLVAIREAEMDRARRDATAAMQLETMRAAQAHERALVAIARDSQRQRRRITAGVLALSLLGALAAGAAYLHDQSAKSAVTTARQTEAAIEQKLALEKLESTLRVQKEELGHLAAAASAAEKDARDRAVAIAAAAAREPASAAPAPATPRKVVSSPPKAKTETCAHEFDPLCRQLP